jgi:replicative DNA helicase
LGLAEDSVLSYSQSLNSGDELPVKIGDGIVEHFDYLGKNQVEHIGISSGFPRWDKSIGQGLRKGTISIIGARVKQGKSTISRQIAIHVAGKLNIPVLNLDLEMMKTDHMYRMAASLSGVSINEIENGKYINNAEHKNKVNKALKQLSTMPYYYKSMAGLTIEEQLAIIRRWLMRCVGLNNDGSAKDCLVIYDYIRSTSDDNKNKNMQEYQILGFLISSLQDFVVKYSIPILSLTQLNREGVDKSSVSTISGSDRLAWTCANFSIFKRKSHEEIIKDGIDNGNCKMIPLICRHGVGLEDNDYINYTMKGEYSQIIEGKLASEVDYYGENRDEQDNKF